MYAILFITLPHSYYERVASLHFEDEVEEEGGKGKKEMLIRRDGYIISRVERRIKLTLNTVTQGTITFTIDKLTIYLRTVHSYMFFVTWKLHKIKYELHVNSIDFMNRLLEYNFICNIDCKRL